MLKFLAFLLITISTLSANALVNCKITSQGELTLPGTNYQLLASNASRKCLILENKDGTNKVYVKFGSTIGGTEGFAIQANSRWEMLIPIMQSVNVKAAAGSPTLSFAEGQ